MNFRQDYRKNLKQRTEYTQWKGSLRYRLQQIKI